MSRFIRRFVGTLSGAVFALGVMHAHATLVPYNAEQAPKNPLNSKLPPALSSAITQERADFLGGITLLGTHDFESGNANFGFSTGTASFTGLTPIGGTGGAQVVDGNSTTSPPPSGPLPAGGRYNMTTGLGLLDPNDPDSQDRGKWLETSKSFSIDFSSAISAIAFFGTDFGDFNGQVSVELFLGAVSRGSQSVDHTLSGTTPLNGNLLFFGVTSTDLFDRVVFSVTQTDPTGNLDYLGIDEFMVGLLRDGGNDAPEPASLALVGLSLIGVAAFRRRKTP